MHIRKLAASAGVAVAALAFAGPTANAEPMGTTGVPAESGALEVNVAPGVRYTAYKDGNAAVVTVDSGRLVVDNGQFQIRSNDGRILAGVPLEVNIDDIAFPVDVAIEGNSASLTPVLDPARARYAPVALPFQDSAPWRTPYEREQAAWNRMTQTVTMGAAVGAIVGAVGSGLIGCLLGGAAGAALTGPLATLFGAGPLAGCLIGAGALAPLGMMAGSIMVAAPVAIAAFVQYQTTINEPFRPAPQPK
ncbi:hypothetical protein APR12_001034 [Nocardia amikacinitolerans]|uniref:hypothetical protein n=1 Tax=Nocardia amikacinitolerans TaxID=756689 RepID=UPI000832A77F|nr:hypothetical protein [Nocardia amikacinitolerans]MCP2315701.1 hypothetical protein [Nocardia amikacinitolerans]